MDDHRFAIDPTHPGFAKTNAMQKIMQERRMHLDRKNGDTPSESGKPQQQDNGKDTELDALVQKLKRRNGAEGEDKKKQRKRSKRG
jgi:hypothetical protein